MASPFAQKKTFSRRMLLEYSILYRHAKYSRINNRKCTVSDGDVRD